MVQFAFHLNLVDITAKHQHSNTIWKWMGFILLYIFNDILCQIIIMTMTKWLLQWKIPSSKRKEITEKAIAVLGGKISLSEHNRCRRSKYADNRPTRHRTHVGVLGNYRTIIIIIIIINIELCYYWYCTEWWPTLSREINKS